MQNDKTLKRQQHETESNTSRFRKDRSVNRTTNRIKFKKRNFRRLSHDYPATWSAWIGLDRWIVHVTHLVKSVQKRDLLHLRKVTIIVTKGRAVSR